jgi:diguanylate cyclase (GGDEF)-like protein/PAS domain S-box-containing protein
MRRSLLFAALGAVVALLYLGGGLKSVERYLLDARADLGSRPATGEVVVVAIDPQSLRWLDVWPWPRHYYADVVEALLAAGAERIALDIDLSSSSQAANDQRLADALAAAGPTRVALPLFRQLHPASDGTLEIVDTGPNPLFAPHVAQVHADFRPDDDGLVRRFESHYHRHGQTTPAISVWLLGGLAGGLAPVPDTVQLDFAIEAASIPRLSFVDVLEGTFDPAVVAGRAVIVGALANELGDHASVPRYQMLPGALVHALALETLIQRRALSTIDGWPIALGTVVLCFLLGPRLARLGAWQGLACGFALGLGLLLLAAGLQPGAAVVLEVSPMLLATLVMLGTFFFQLVQRKDALIRRVVDNCFDAIVTFDEQQRVLSVNRAAGNLFGRTPEQAIGSALVELLTLPPGCPGEISLHAARRPQELIAHSLAGPPFPVEVAFSTMRVHGQWVGIAALRDIRERKAQEAELRRMALHDPLTGLANRALLHDRLEQAIALAARSGARVALLLLDLDRFKEVNDTLGHQVGDILLQQIGPRLERVLRDSDTLARLGGDEFALVLPEVAEPAACAVAERIVDLFRHPFQIDTLDLELGVSIGVAYYPTHGEGAAELLQRADVAMYGAKRGQTGFEIYRADDDRHSVQRLTLQGELRRTIEDGLLMLYYQPKIATGTATLTGVEALVRWHHAEHGFVPPEEFVGLAERTGLIRPLTRWVIKTVLLQQRAWQQRSLDLSVAVNLSVRLLQDPDFPGRLQELIDEVGGRPCSLQLEITESALMAEPDTAMMVLGRLAAMGCRLSLDDFGTGYSSLAYLQRLPIDELKIDRSFVLAMNRDSAAATIVRSVVNLAHSLDLGVVAEGVEGPEIYERLRILGCDQVQGHLIGQPMPAETFETWLTTTSWMRDPVTPV